MTFVEFVLSQYVKVDDGVNVKERFITATKYLTSMVYAFTYLDLVFT